MRLFGSEWLSLAWVPEDLSWERPWSGVSLFWMLWFGLQGYVMAELCCSSFWLPVICSNRGTEHQHNNSFLSFLAKAGDLLFHAWDQAQTHAHSVSHFDFQWLSYPACRREGNYNSNNSLCCYWKISKCFLSSFLYQCSSERWQSCNWYFTIISLYYLFKLLTAFCCWTQGTSEILPTPPFPWP